MTTSPDNPTASSPVVHRRWLVLLPWLAGASLYALLAAMLHFRVAHPHFLPVVSLVALLVVATCLALLAGLRRLLLGPRRVQGLRLLTFATLPLALLALHGTWANSREEAELRIEGYRLRLLFPLAESIMDLEARFRYPERTAGRKVVMIHAAIPDAAEQVEAMDRHLERMERLLGHEAAGKCHWIRGGLLGLGGVYGGVCFFGIAMGSQGGEQRRGPDGLTSLDRHEVAHWAIDNFFDAYHDRPPPILGEGWAVTQSGHSRWELFSRAAHYREGASWVPLKELILPGHEDFNVRIYDHGGVLVDHLLSRYGGPAFFDFYHDCTPNSFDADCHRHLGLNVEELESAYSRYIDNTIAHHGSLLQWWLEEMHCGPNVDPEKWRAFVRMYAASIKQRRELEARFTVVGKYQSLGPPPAQGNWETRFALSGPFALSTYEVPTARTLSVVQPSVVWEIRRETGKTWEGQKRTSGPDRAYRLRSLRREAADWLKPIVLEDYFLNRVDASLITVTELAEFEEGGKPRLRVTFELPPRRSAPAARRTMILAVDQDYAPIVIEEQNVVPTDANTTRIQREYQIVEGQRILRKQSGETTTPDGKQVSVFSSEIKDLKFGPIPPEHFTLKSLGVNESEIVVHNDASSSAGKKTGWQKKLPWWIAGWIFFCLLTLATLAAASLPRLCACNVTPTRSRDDVK